MTSKFLKFIVAALILCNTGSVFAQKEGDFPLPAGLERDVGFWVAIFSKYSTNEGVLHDNRNLAVVYETVALPESASRRTRQRVSGNRRKHYQNILRKLADGRRANLSAEEQRVLDLWPDDVTNKELAAEEGVVPSAISHRLGTAIGHLRKLIEQRAEHDKKFGCAWEEYGTDLLGDG